MIDYDYYPDGFPSLPDDDLRMDERAEREEQAAEREREDAEWSAGVDAWLQDQQRHGDGAA